uniref:UBIQUITIN_CONJUGAT_2 domain-containing protein n=1 Tax=Parastrongyloides trichosuri TaxID=131310 RepID=A0A0N4ZVW3_PARTI
MASSSKPTPASLRIMKEISEMMDKETDEIFKVHVNEKNIFDIHFTFVGKEKEYKNGLYHGRMILPKDYPMRPPDFWMITENGRFQTCTKLCMSNTSFHPDQWSPSWGIRTAILGLISLFYEESDGSVGSIKKNEKLRRHHAIISPTYKCNRCESSLYKLWYGFEMDDDKKKYLEGLISQSGGLKTKQEKRGGDNNNDDYSTIILVIFGIAVLLVSGIQYFFIN